MSLYNKEKHFFIVGRTALLQKLVENCIDSNSSTVNGVENEELTDRAPLQDPCISSA